MFPAASRYHKGTYLNSSTFKFTAAGDCAERALVDNSELLIISKEVFERRTSTGSGINRNRTVWFCPNSWTDRLYNSKDT